MPYQPERPRTDPSWQHDFPIRATEPPPAIGQIEPPAAAADEETTRKEIVRIIGEKPGIYLRELARTLQLSVTTVRYHVDRLEAEGAIHSERTGRYRHLFGADQDQGTNTMFLNVLNALNEPPRDKVLEHLLVQPGSRPSEIARALELAEGTIAHHLRVLEGRGLIDVQYGPGGRRITLPTPVAEIVKDPPFK